MRDFPIPVVAAGAGSQVEDAVLDYLPLPNEMQTFAMPVCNLEADPEVLAATCTVLGGLRDSMSAGKEAKIELTGLPPDVVELINQSLGQGEVSVLVREPGNLHIQETVFAGVWRVQALSAQGVLLSDVLHACAIPPQVQQSAQAGTGVINSPQLNDGVMNAPAVLNELRERSLKHKTGDAAHVINLSLLPMTVDDLGYLHEAFGTGGVSILSRGYGNCRITSTRLAHVWWVQYFNSMDQIILNTLEVVDVPQVALAAAEDFEDSTERLGEWLAVMCEQDA
ncbi:MAG: hydrogenase expression/formation protein [Gallionella sp.]|jgi:hydrogenase-1 operon protein HyaF